MTDALDYIRKRLGFVNKKLQIQQKINFMINDLVEKKQMEKYAKVQEKRKRLENLDKTDSRIIETIDPKAGKASEAKKEENDGEVKIISKEESIINKDLRVKTKKSPGSEKHDPASPDKYSDKFESEGEIDKLLPQLD